MSVTSHRQEIEDILVALLSQTQVPGETGERQSVGQVLPGRHHFREPEDFLDLLTEKTRGDSGDRIIKGWEFYWTGYSDTRTGAEGVATNRVRRTYTYELVGVLGYDPKTHSELQFNKMVSAMMDTLGGYIRSGPHLLRTRASSGSFEIQPLGDVLVHTATIELSFEEDLIVT